MFNTPSQSVNTFDITDVGYIERVVVGTTDPGQIPTEEETQAKLAIINRCLTEFPKGRIIGVERSFSVVRIGEHQVVLEAVVYHIGFKKPPMWLEESKRAKPNFQIDPKKVEQIVGQYE
ncbi:hypothetical protein [Shewanella sp. SR44-3]|jgi:hypothetical protein|uniref:hypothetical protein n=1 Tax=unclassified Shewanella TaxID=196818 RepID=UPI001C728F66|nr:hypothetical protein [Shewanella sp. SR44-3]